MKAASRSFVWRARWRAAWRRIQRALDGLKAAAPGHPGPAGPLLQPIPIRIEPARSRARSPRRLE